MTYLRLPADNYINYEKTLTSTSATRVHSPVRQSDFIICETLWLTDTSGSGTTYTIEIYRSNTTTSTTRAQSQTLSANATVEVNVTGIRLRPGDELRVTAGHANRIDTILVTTQTSRNS